ncbi:MAG: hypothetical protein R2909_08545 [Gemmatimonadales bacterium]
MAQGFTLPAAGKTGTTNDGWTSTCRLHALDLVTGVWMAFDRAKPIGGNAQGGLAGRAGVDGDDEGGLSAPAGA